MQPTQALPIILPTLTSLLGLAGLSSGIYTFISPLDVIRPFGLIQPSTTSDKSSSSTKSQVQPFDQALLRVYGIRNIGVGLSTLSLTWFWKSQVVGSVAERVARKCLGICMVTGTVVGAGDAWLVRRFGADADHLKGEERKEVMGASTGHAITSVVILGSGLLLLLG